MFDEQIGREYMVFQSGSSEGAQVKYRKGPYWYKKDNQGREGLAEYLASGLLRFSDLEPDEYVIYEQGLINGKPGCRSRDFLGKEDSIVTFYRLYYNEFGRNLSEVIAGMDTMEERIEYVLRFIRRTCGIDVRDYLKKVLTLDMLILNEDRHLNNLAVVYRENGFAPAPIFDNGVSLLTANRSVNWNFPVEENVKRVIARPFAGSHEKMAAYLGTGFQLDLDGCRRWLRQEEDSREKEVLLHQLKRYEELFHTGNGGE